MTDNSKDVDAYVQSLPEWQRVNLRLFREHIHKADPDVIEEIKWGVPTFTSGNKLLFSMAAFKAHTKYNFIGNGALLDDKAQLFNNGLESKRSRSIDLQEGQTLDIAALEDLIEQAVKKL